MRTLAVAAVSSLFLPSLPACSTQVPRLATEACGRADESGFRSFFDDSGVPRVEVQGRWQSRGYGFVCDAQSNGATLYCRTESFLYPVDAPMQESELFYRPGPDEGLLLTSHPAEIPIVLERTAASLELRRPDAGDFDDLFEVFVETVAEHYAFFDLWEVDWSARVQSGRRSLSGVTTDAELFDLFTSMLAGIDDAHLGLTAEVDGEPRTLETRRGPTKERIRELFAQQDEFDSLNRYYNAWYRGYWTGIDDQLLAGKGRKAAAGTLRYGWLDDEVGYLHVGGMEGPGSDGLLARIATLDRGLDEALTELSSARALVLDVTHNRGGRDAFGLAVAARFADQRRLAYVKLPVVAGDVRHEVFIEPSERPGFRGPIVVLTSDITVSAAETFVLCMRVLPHVTIAGQRTRGAFSDMLEKPLPNGFLLSLSNQRFVGPAGVCYERWGVPPDVPLTVFDPIDPWHGHVEAVRAACELVR